MSAEKKAKADFTLGKGQTLRVGTNIRMHTEGEYTKIDMGDLASEYKLSQAYANIRNLEFRSDKEIKIQSFKEYRELRGQLFTAAWRWSASKDLVILVMKPTGIADYRTFTPMGICWFWLTRLSTTPWLPA